jgi:acetylornithine deacetylase/succinyl-diaminopimelate desuccinylase-like protein
MKSQVAAEAVAGATLARRGWRPATGALKLVFVSDEETGGELGAHWLCDAHPDKVRCDMLLNEGGGEVFEYGGRRRYGVCCAEKGIFRFNITAVGAAGHASLPRTGDNALLKLAPVLAALAAAPESFELTEAPTALLRGLGEDPGDPAGAMANLAAADPLLRTLVEPMFGVTLTPTMASASEKINVIPSRARVRVDCRVPPGLGEDAARRRIAQVLGDQLEGLEIAFTEQVTGNASPVHSELMSAIETWVADHDPGAAAVPTILPGFSDSRWFRDAFPECVAYGFFPQRHQPLLHAAPLVHNADERIDVRDLGFAAACYFDLAAQLLG